ncbi:MAG TPA: PKD domain-containing protein, partial [Bacteroidia bacterium]
LTDGSFTVRMISSTNIGQCKDTMDKVMTVFPMPVASFIVDNDKQCFLNNVFNFNSTSNVSSGTIDAYDWKMGDNTSSNISSPVKSYTKVDSFRVRLLVTTDKGCTDSFASKVYVYPMPVASFSLNRKFSCLLKNSFLITNKSSIPNGGTIALYQYYYGNNDSSLLKDPVAYSYPASGQYTIMQRVTSDKGCWDTATSVVTINPNPNLAFTVDSVCFKDSSIFVNNSTIVSGTIDQWKWIFGDGKTSTLQSPKHKYKAVGVYDITLIAVTNSLCTDTLKKVGAAKVNANPKAGFYYTKQRSWENEVDIQYTDTSLGAQSWKWDFASMGTSTDQNPKLYYVDTLTQLTRLIVTNSVGCSDTTTKLIFIAPDVVYYMPSAFTPNDDNINETFKPIGLSYAINYKFIVFNRWGEILFKTDNPQLGWDGKFDGELVEQDLYFYRLEFVGVDELRHEEKGNIMILR